MASSSISKGIHFTKMGLLTFVASLLAFPGKALSQTTPNEPTLYMPINWCVLEGSETIQKAEDEDKPVEFYINNRHVKATNYFEEAGINIVSGPISPIVISVPSVDEGVVPIPESVFTDNSLLGVPELYDVYCKCRDQHKAANGGELPQGIIAVNAADILLQIGSSTEKIDAVSISGSQIQDFILVTDQFNLGGGVIGKLKREKDKATASSLGTVLSLDFLELKTPPDPSLAKQLMFPFGLGTLLSDTEKTQAYTYLSEHECMQAIPQEGEAVSDILGNTRRVNADAVEITTVSATPLKGVNNPDPNVTTACVVSNSGNGSTGKNGLPAGEVTYTIAYESIVRNPQIIASINPNDSSLNTVTLNEVAGINVPSHFYFSLDEASLRQDSVAVFRAVEPSNNEFQLVNSGEITVEASAARLNIIPNDSLLQLPALSVPLFSVFSFTMPQEVYTSYFADSQGRSRSDNILRATDELLIATLDQNNQAIDTLISNFSDTDKTIQPSVDVPVSATKGGPLRLRYYGGPPNAQLTVLFDDIRAESSEISWITNESGQLNFTVDVPPNSEGDKLQVIVGNTTNSLTAVNFVNIERGAEVIVTDDISTTTIWEADKSYLLDGLVVVEEGVTLVIEPGTVIKGRSLDNIQSGDGVSALVVSQGARIEAVGTRENPIIFTSEQDDLSSSSDLGKHSRGLWGGLIVLGDAVTNEGEDKIFPGTNESVPLTYGGTDDDDDSGILKYVSIRHGGASLLSSPGYEIGGLTLAAVGRNTLIEYVDVFAGLDDCFDFWGGTVNTRYLSGAFCEDDSYDTDEGFRGFGQFWFSLDDENTFGLSGEHDGGRGANEEALPFGRPIIANATYIGAGRDASLNNSPNRYVFWFRDNSGGGYYNSIAYDFPEKLLRIEDLLDPSREDSQKRFELGDLQIKNNIFDRFGAGVTLDELVEGTFTPDTLDAFNNVMADPLLAGISREPDGSLDPRLNPQSPALFGGSSITYFPETLENQPLIERATNFFVKTPYRGAFGRDHWLTGWTALSDLGYLGDLVQLPESHLINAETDSKENGFGPLTNGTILDQAALTFAHNIEVDFLREDLQEVVFSLNGQTMIREKRPPYALFGDNNGDFNEGRLPVGSLVVEATPFLNGEDGLPVELNVEVINSNPNAVTGLFLVDAASNAEVFELVNGATYDVSDLPENVNVVAKSESTTKSVLLNLNDGYFQRLENVPPFALYGDSGSNFFSGVLPVGAYTLSATPYSEQQRNGDQGPVYTISFTIAGVASKQQVLPSGYSEEPINGLQEELPEEYTLSANYPNPFNPETTIKFSVPEMAPVELVIFDLLGRRVSTLVDQVMIAGQYEIRFDGSDLPSGMYFYVMKTPEHVMSQKMILLK